MSKTTDTQYEDTQIASVRPHENGYEVEFADKGWLFISDPGFAPKPGDSARCYGKGFGYSVRGLDIDGREVYYKTEDEWRADFRERRDRQERERKEALEAKGGVSHDPGAENYDWREEMGEISGFGDTYEAACRSMLVAALDFWDGQDESFDPKYKGFEDVYGVCLDDNDDAKKLDEAIMDAEIVYGDGTRERCGDGASGAMHQAVISHAFFVRKNGWERYVQEMSEESR